MAVSEQRPTWRPRLSSAETVDEYILDFFAPALRLAIEIDGESHNLKGEADEQRQAKLEALGIHFLRFDDAMVKSRRDEVVLAIDNWIAAHAVKR